MLVIHLMMHLGFLVFRLILGVLLMLVLMDFQCAGQSQKRQTRKLIHE